MVDIYEKLNELYDKRRKIEQGAEIKKLKSNISKEN